MKVQRLSLAVLSAATTTSRTTMLFPAVAAFTASSSHGCFAPQRSVWKSAPALTSSRRSMWWKTMMAAALGVTVAPPADIRRALQDPATTVVDVRTLEEMQKDGYLHDYVGVGKCHFVHAPGTKTEAPLLQLAAPSLIPDVHAPVVVYCASGMRAAATKQVLEQAEPDLWCDLLLELGACATSITDADYGTDREEPVFREPSPSSFIYESSSHTVLPEMLWNRCHVTAHFPASTDIPTTLRLAHEIWFRGDSDDDRTTGTLRLLDEYTIQSIPHQDWVVTVQRGWTPIVVSNRFVLRFPWHTDQDVAKAVRASSSSSSTGSKQSHRPLVSLQLQGGIAFGTGEHPTTQLCLEWLDAVITPMLPNESISSSSSSPQSQPPQPPPRPTLTVLDYGSGSGILGLAACALSTPRGTVTAVGFDVDVDACVIANVNAANNDLPMRSYLPPLVAVNDDDDIDDDDIDDVSKSQLFKAHHRIHQRKEDGRDETGNSKTVGGVVLQDLILCDDPEPFDVAVANIMAGPLVALAPTLARRIKPGARLGMSGILPHQGDMVVQAYRAAGFANVHVAKEMGGWLLVTAQKPEN